MPWGWIRRRYATGSPGNVRVWFSGSWQDMKRFCVGLLVTSGLLYAQSGWWMTEPIRWVQTNLRQTDASLDAKHLVDQLADMRANVLLFGMGGIVAYYPPKVPF